ncbi:hypothetical protein D5086_031458 [Populus alba]|uniref:Uncharacterized protein n=1 Tax=Populus alba TaxID=43335 RepID=A0ACC4AJK9_POPAL
MLSNQGQFPVLLAIQMGKLNASGVEALDSSFLAITYSAKFLPEIPLVLFVLERGQFAALIVKELAFEPGGWGSLPSPSKQHCNSVLRKLKPLTAFVFDSQVVVTWVASGDSKNVVMGSLV